MSNIFIDKLYYDEHDPHWNLFMGNNHRTIKCGSKWGGGISFARHLGKPLTDELWKDLVGRLNITGLCIYQYGDAEWCMGWGGGKCIIHLDKDDNVGDIHYYQ